MVSVRAGWLCLGALLLVGLHTSARGQTYQGSLTGTVTDPSGGVIQGVQVTAVEQATGFSRFATTGDDGSYSIVLLPPGSYRVTAEKEDFDKTTQGPIALAVNQHQLLNFQLKLGRPTTVLTVEAPAVVVDTQSSSVGTTVGQASVSETPLNGRQFLELMMFTPGLVPGTPGSKVYDRGGSINVNGMQDSMNSFWLDGLDDTSSGVGQFTVAPPVDSIQEMRLETGVYDAKFGVHAGAQVNVVTKSGTNQFHGSLFEFLRNADLDARNFFEPSVPPFVRNQFGGTVGGPVVLPKIYDGHDKTFFFFTYEGLREHRSFDNRTVVPTVAERNGDFTDLLSPQCPVQTVLLNPFALAQGQIQTFTNINQVYPTGPDPVGQGLVDLYPMANVPNAACGAVNNVTQVQRRIDLNTYMVRLDQRWGSKNNFFFRFNFNGDKEFDPSLGSFIPGYGTFGNNHFLETGIDWTHQFTPSLLNEFKFAYNRYQLNLLNQDFVNTSAQQLGIQGLQPAGQPQLTFTGYNALGSDPTVPQVGAVNSFQLADTITQVKGNHSLAYGIDFRAVRRGNFSIDSIIRGEFDFTGLVTGGLGQLPAGTNQLLGCVSPGCTLGNSVADALLGLPTDWISGFQQYISGALGEYDAFFQDTWKIRRNLTLTLGLRYEYNGLTTDKNNHLANFDFNNGLLLVAGTNHVTLETFDPKTNTFKVVGTTSLGSTNANRAVQLRDWDNFAPRVGFAWQPFDNAKTVIRGGWGVYYNQTFGDVYFQKSANPPFVKITAGNLGGALPAIESGQIPPGTGALITTALTGAGPAFPTTSPFQLNFMNAFIQQYTFDIQRQLGTSWLVDLAYVGSQGLHLPRETDPNQQINSNPALCIQFAGCPRPYSLYSGFSYTESSGSSSYSAFQAKVQRQFSRGLNLIGSYTWSKSIDTASGAFGDTRNPNFPQNSRDLAAEKGLSDFDYRNRFSLAYVYQLPIGSTAWRLDNHSLNYLIKNWQLAGIATAQSGPHFTANISGDISGADETVIAGQPTDRPNVSGAGFYPANKTPNQWALPSGFSAQAPYTFGNAGRNILQGPGISSWDFSIIRNFPFKESMNLEFRAEMFNIFNRPNFDIPYRDLASSSFGVIPDTLPPIAGEASGGPGDPREVQFGLRLTW